MPRRNDDRERFTEGVTVPEDRSRSGRRRLLVLSPTGAQTFSVDKPRLTVGRSVDADVQVEDAALSRIHVSLAFDPLTVTDLGSSNGTRLRGTPIAANTSHEFEIGDVIDCGHTTLVVQEGMSVEVAHRIWAHEHYLTRMQDLCADGEPFAVIRARIAEVPAPMAEATLTSIVSPRDLAARYAPGEYEIAIRDADVEGAEDAVAALRFGLNRVGANVQAGIAVFPQDGSDAESLSSLAGRRLFGESSDEPSGLVIESRAMVQLYALAERVAPSDLSVLVLGETGVGKEVLANHVHAKSKRAAKPFVAINCGGFTEELLESELFGHERGAFTGAVQAKPGLLETAEGGTVFLDELGEMSPSTQVKLLRVLEDRQVRRLGSVKPTQIDTRLIAATNQDLEDLIRRGAFREDLYYRLNGISLVVPPLRERTDEIQVFASAFAKNTAEREGRVVPRFGDDAIAAFMSYAWPGNVRELKNVVERAVILAIDGVITREHLPMDRLSSSIVFASPRGGSLSPPAPTSLGEEIDSLEKQRILDALEKCGGNQSRAAELLGISRKTLLRRLDRYGVPRPRKK
ncbi:MAG: sigma 54-interacting transcriptional regulator [Deltaproteobacteria bacterium]